MAATDTQSSTETMKLEVFRYLPDEGEPPGFQVYEVPYRDDWVVLDALNYIKDEIDGTLSVTAGRVGWGSAAAAA